MSGDSRLAAYLISRRGATNRGGGGRCLEAGKSAQHIGDLRAPPHLFADQHLNKRLHHIHFITPPVHLSQIPALRKPGSVSISHRPPFPPRLPRDHSGGIHRSTRTRRSIAPSPKLAFPIQARPPPISQPSHSCCPPRPFPASTCLRPMHSPYDALPVPHKDSSPSTGSCCCRSPFSSPFPFPSTCCRTGREHLRS